jgi:hypothetical protein
VIFRVGAFCGPLLMELAITGSLEEVLNLNYSFPGLLLGTSVVKSAICPEKATFDILL